MSYFCGAARDGLGVKTPKPLSKFLQNASRTRRQYAPHEQSASMPLTAKHRHGLDSAHAKTRGPKPPGTRRTDAARNMCFGTCVRPVCACVRTRVHACSGQARPLGRLPCSPAWPGWSGSSRGRPPALGRLTPASTPAWSAVASASSVHSTGSVGVGEGEGWKRSPAGVSDQFSIVVPVVARHGSAARAARRTAKHNTRSGQWTGGRHQRGRMTGSAEHLQSRSMRSSGRR